MTVSWPSTLPDFVRQSGYKKQAISNAVTIDTESGEPMTRLRFSGDLSQIAASIIVKSTDGTLAAFWSFWKNDLARGTLRFLWDDPSSGGSVEFLFDASSPPVETCIGGTTFQIDMSLIMFA